LAALYLAQRNCNVVLVEKAPIDKDAMGTTVGPRTYNILLAKRSLLALEGAGVKLGDDESIMITHIVRYRKGAKKFMAFPAHVPWSRTINRGSLAGLLVRACEAYAGGKQQGSGSIKLRTGYSLSQLDVAARKATFAPVGADSSSQGQGQAGGEPFTLTYDLIIGADGTFSRLRQVLSEDAGVKASPEGPLTFTQEQDTMMYKPFTLASLQGLSIPLENVGSKFVVLADPKRNHSLFIFPTKDGVHRGTYLMPDGDHASHKSESDYVASLSDSFPVLNQAQLREIAAQLPGTPASSGGFNTRCSRLHAPGALLIGDAAHAMWPSLGQGASSALEDCAVLGKLLGPGPVSKAQLEALPAAFSAARHADVVAAVDLTEAGFGGKMQRTRAASPINLHMARFIGQMLLSKALPFLVPKPALMTLNDTTTPYTVVQHRVERQRVGGNIVLGGLALLAAYGVARAVMP